MAFHDVRFPENLSFGAIGGPERRTDIVTLANGHEERNTPWAHSRRRFDAGSGLRSLDDLQRMVGFFEARSGQLHGFRWKDWSDFKSCKSSAEPDVSDQIIGTGDGLTTVMGLTKSYRSGQQSYVRPIVKPVRGSVLIGMGGMALQESVDFEVAYDAGRITFAHPPDLDAVVTAGFAFDVPVRFDTDRIETAVATFQAGQAPSVPVIEVRL